MAAAAERTQVAIVGAGPAGLLLAELLAREGIASTILEQRSRAHCLARVRAGVLEHDVAALVDDLGVGARMRRDGLVHGGVQLQLDGAPHRIDLAGLTGRSVVVYGQQELTRDLVEHLEAKGRDLRFEAGDVAVHDHDASAPRVTFTHDGRAHELRCDVVAGCDGFHGVCREVIPEARRRTFTRAYPYAWLGILAQAAPAIDELVYCSHDCGFALYSLRSPEVSRLYLQVPPDERVERWPDERVWDELDVRLGRAADPAFRPTRGATLEKGVTPMRSFVSEPMRDGRLFLAGDAAHIVPPTGAKGLNLAANDAMLLARALGAWLRDGDETLARSYSDDCLARVWRAEDFSMFMTRLLHVPEDPFERRAQLARLRYVCGSEAAMRSLAENYVGLPAERLRPLRWPHEAGRMTAQLVAAEEAAGLVRDGDTVMVGGFGLVGAPLTLIDALVEHSAARDLTIVSNNIGEPGRGLGKLLRQGRIRKAISSYFTSNPEAVDAAMSGQIEYELLPQGTLAEAIRAGGAGLRGFYTPVGAGTLLAAGKEEREIDGVRCVLELPLKADVALVYATWADRLGNLRYRRTAQNFNAAMATAARLTIAEAAEIVEVGALEPESVHTPYLYVDRLVERRIRLADIPEAGSS